MADKLNVAFRGTRGGLVIVIDEAAPYDVVKRDLTKKLKDSGYFFVGADVTVDVGGRELNPEDLQYLRDMIQGKHGLIISAVKARSETTKSAAAEIKLPVTSFESTSEKEDSSESEFVITDETPLTKTAEELPTEIVRRTLRSGQKHESDGNVVILGDVNAGAEVIAGGDVIVLGALRGMAFAGSTGKTDAIILAAKLNPTQLRIADRAARSPEESTESRGYEYAFIEDDHIMIDRWGRR